MNNQIGLYISLVYSQLLILIAIPTYTKELTINQRVARIREVLVENNNPEINTSSDGEEKIISQWFNESGDWNNTWSNWNWGNGWYNTIDWDNTNWINNWYDAPWDNWPTWDDWDNWDNSSGWDNWDNSSSWDNWDNSSGY